jgi:predicted HicB family RNase H-like nuclease
VKVWCIEASPELSAAAKKAAARREMSMAAYVRGCVMNQVKQDGIEVEVRPDA